MRASLELRVAGIRSSFTTRNPLSRTASDRHEAGRGRLQVSARRMDIPCPGEDACKVCLSLDFETSSLLAPAFAMGFQGLADKMVDDFCRQADRDD